MESVETNCKEAPNIICVCVDVKEGQELTAGILPATDCGITWEINKTKKDEALPKRDYSHRFSQSGRFNIYIVGDEIESLNIDNWGATEVKIFNCPTLKHFSCHKNKLESLDLRKCTELESLNCSNNRLQQLSIHDLPKLQTVNASYNRLETANLLRCSRLEKANFVRNPICQAIVKGCHQLKSLRCKQVEWDLTQFCKPGDTPVVVITYPKNMDSIIYVEPPLMVRGQKVDEEHIITTGCKEFPRLVGISYCISTLFKPDTPELPSSSE